MTAGANTKIHSIQLLRGLAALAVASVHLWFGFASFVDSRDPPPAWSDIVAPAAVAAFFVISGCVMVVSSRRLFGSARGTLTFWRRRAVRVLPPYWIATLLFAGVALVVGLPADAGFVLRSLVFVPTEGAAEVPFLPFLWPGWTLFYELVFYAIFGAFLLANRARAIGYTAGVLIVVVASAAFWPPETWLAAAFAHPIVLLFLVGMGAGVLFDAGRAVPLGLRVLAGAGAVAVVALGPDLLTDTVGWDALFAAGLPGILAFIAVAGGPIPSRMARLSDAFGDLSYALYLLHIPFAHAWILVFNVWLSHPGGSLGYMIAGLPLLLALSWAFHRGVERPLTRLLNSRAP